MITQGQNKTQIFTRKKGGPPPHGGPKGKGKGKKWRGKEEEKEKKKKITPSNYKVITSYSNSFKSGVGERMPTGYKELDRVLGKGLVEGEVVLLSGEPGVGKSTLLMQIVLNFSKKGKVLYVCGEESPSQFEFQVKKTSIEGTWVKGGG